MRRTWSLIVATTLASLACWGAVLLSLRAFAAPQSESAPAVESPTPEPPPDERGAADNSVSFPVDI